MKHAGADIPLTYSVTLSFDDPADDEQAVARLVRSLNDMAEDGCPRP
ncbi:hypothetical protein P1P68_00770 [Streptomyces scabiei]|nr:hypothetical protein [Streptomyces scabiei]MDW8803380.1 hypothetical protein [Streptomyces scabiei]